MAAGGYGGTLVYQAQQASQEAAREAARQPNIQATSINIQPTSDPRYSTVVNDGIVANSATFDYSAPLSGTYTLVFDNSFSTFSSKSVSLTYTVSGASHTQSFVVSAGDAQKFSLNLNTGVEISGSFSVSGGSGNDIEFYITARTCTQTVNFSFTLVNSGDSNGYATVHFTADGLTYWTNRYYVPQSQQVTESGNVILGDCSGHVENIVVTQQEKA